ncbi:type VI secretion system baseplate subunit TssK [Parendozoicomonas sp. Alg238-R29]|uniref:type VI secretion system baseplate subunit TssK n=1 Tax=Parendozoicomonas sp. Alg238-R29 TaxID=2993446 RepID=UPI00248E785B|nr:type VI secretion system baseplate subunit TssK [Parendozoicomonas sp. Alg238-R29]
MISASNTVWLEGMFITPQHFQQHDRYMHSFIRDWMNSRFGESWGVRSLDIDKSQYQVGRVRIMSVQGVFPDGTPFVSPEELILQIPPGTVNKKVYLAVPLYRPGQVNTVRNASPTIRYTSFSADVVDDCSSDNDVISIEQCRLNLSLQLEGWDMSCYSLIPVLDIREVHSDGSLVVNSSFVPPCLDVSASPVILEQLNELLALIVQRSRQACQRLQAGAQAKSRQMRVLDLLWLQTLNRWQPWFATSSNMSCVDMHRELAMCLGDILALMPEPLPDIPSFNHSDPGPSMLVLFRSLRRVLSSMADERVLVIEWNYDQFAEKRLLVLEEDGSERLQSGRVVLGVKSSLGVVMTGQRFVNASKLVGSRRIDELVCSALPGIRLEQMPVAPAELQSQPDIAYFEVDRSDSLWRELTSAADRLVIHIDERLPDVELTLYVIRTGDSL